MDVKLLTICMIRDGDRVLLVNKLNHPDPQSRGFIPPGGKVERGESPVEAAIREVAEETGLIVSELVYKGLYAYENSSTGARYMIFNYLTTHFKGELRSDSPEGTVEWIPIAVARTLPMEASWKTRFGLFFELGTFEFHTMWDAQEERPAGERLIRMSGINGQ